MQLLKVFLVIGLAGFLVAGCSKNKLNIPEGGLGTNMDDVEELNAAGMIRVGQRMEDAGDYASAATFYADAISRDSQLIDGHLGLARILEIAGQPRQAAFHFGHALALDPNNMEAIRGYARDKINGEQPLDASNAISKYLEENPATPALLNYLGVAYDLQNRHADAENAYRRGLQITTRDDPWQTILVGNLALSLGLGGNYSEAILLLNPYVGDMRLGPKAATEEQSQLRQNLALVYALSGNPDAAVEVAKSALKEDEAESNRPFYQAVAGLVGYDRAKAVFLGEMPE